MVVLNSTDFVLLFRIAFDTFYFTKEIIIVMGKSILFLFMFLMSSAGVFAQGYYDDMYYTPSAEKESVEEEVSLDSSNDNYIKESDDREYGNGDIVAGRDVDEYNRRYAPDPVAEPVDTVASRVKSSKSYYSAEYDDEGWVNGFNGSQSDYEYSTRIIRMSSPSLAIHVSSPLYWDVVYGSSSFDWNVYVDGIYAYAFPTFSNPLWWDWRYSYPYYGFYNRWYYSYYSGFYGGYPYYWGGWHHHHYYPYYGYGCYPHYGYYPHYGWHGSAGYYNGNKVYRNNYRTGSSGRTGSTGNRVGTTTRRSSSGSYNGTVRRSSINNSGTVRRSSSTYDRRSSSNSSWSGFDDNSSSSSSFDSSPRRSSSTYNRRSSTFNSSFDSGSSNRRSSYSSPSRSGSYNSSRSSYTPSSRSGSRR